MKFERTFFVGVQDVDRNKEITNRALIEMFSNLATLHGISVGQTANEGTSPVSWIVLGWKLQVIRRAKVCDTVRARTWGNTYTKLRANRDFDVLSEDGEVLARATSVWVGLDGNTGSFLRLTPELMDPFALEPESVNFPDYKFPNAHHLDYPVISSLEIRPARWMIDYNDHVHNAAYLDLASEVLPEEVYRASFAGTEVLYKQEVHPDEPVRLEYARDNGKHLVLMRDVEGGELRAAVIWSNG